MRDQTFPGMTNHPRTAQRRWGLDVTMTHGLEVVGKNLRLSSVMRATKNNCERIF